MIVARKRGFAGPPQRRSRKLFADYQDRILLGSDSDLEGAMNANYFRWLETGDEYLPTGTSPPGTMGNLWNGTARYGFRKGLS
jgi:hypothetical protein